jgi:hypothetical protein
MRKGLACVRGLATGDKRSQCSQVLHICRRLLGSRDVGDQPVQSPTIRASREDLWLAERRSQDSLPFPVLPGYRPMRCLEGLLSGGRTANRTRVHIHTLASPAARAFRVPGRLEPGGTNRPPSLGSTAFGFVGPACFGGGLWARLLRVLGSLPLILGSEGVRIWVLDRF